VPFPEKNTGMTTVRPEKFGNCPALDKEHEYDYSIGHHEAMHGELRSAIFVPSPTEHIPSRPFFCGFCGFGRN
jgi:hypothetical protein